MDLNDWGGAWPARPLGPHAVAALVCLFLSFMVSAGPWMLVVEIHHPEAFHPPFRFDFGADSPEDQAFIQRLRRDHDERVAEQARTAWVRAVAGAALFLAAIGFGLLALRSSSFADRACAVFVLVAAGVLLSVSLARPSGLAAQQRRSPRTEWCMGHAVRAFGQGSRPAA